MNNNLFHKNADRLHSITLARCYCFLINRIYYHIRMENYMCFCFECQLQNLLCELFTERVGQRYLFHRNLHNYNEVDDIEILGKFLVADM